MKRTLRALLLFVTLVAVQVALLSGSLAADFSAIWDGGNGNWDDPLHWNTNPNYPNNTGGITYDATINSGHVTLDRDIALQRFFFNNGMLDGAFTLNLNEGFNWTNGTIGASTTVNLAAGSTSTLATDAYGATLYGTLNNSGTVNQTDIFHSFGVVNNLVGATWNLQSSINPPLPFYLVGIAGQFNNAGSMVVKGYDGLFSFFNNSGNVTIEMPTPGDVSFLFLPEGTASGSFHVASQASLALGSYQLVYSLTSGARIDGSGSTGVSDSATVSVTGNVMISTNLANHGTLLITSGATLVLQGSFEQSSGNVLYLTTQLDGGTITTVQTLNFQAGSLTGSGTINGDVISNATISPGASAGTLTINGNVSLLNNSKLVMEIGGLTQGTQYDHLATGGMVTLDGTLELRMLNGFQLQLDPSQTFTLLTSKDVISGAFDNVANGARLTTADGLASFQVNYGAGSPYGANNVVLSDPQAVPEPASFVLFVGGALALGFARFRRR